MTHKQRQNLLQFLGYYVGAVDNLWGTMSRIAMEAFQRDQGLPVTGRGDKSTDAALLAAVADWRTDVTDINVGNSTGNWWDEIEHFSRSEFKCTCGGRGCNGYPAEPRERLIRNAEAAGSTSGSLQSSPAASAASSGTVSFPGTASNSLHLSGRAMDLGISGVSAAQLLAYVKQLPEVHEAYAIDGSYVHMGVQKY